MAKGDRWSDVALLLLRVALGVTFLAHGAQKLFGAFSGPGVAGVAGFFGKLGIPLPGVMAWVISLLEFFGGLAIGVGLFTRWVAVLLACNMAVALLKVHLPRGFFVSTGGVELVLLLGTIALALALLGPGGISLDRQMGRK